MDYYQFRAMNCDLLLAAEGPQSRTAAGFRAAAALVQESEKRFTRFSEDSELSALNRAAGSWFQASPELFEVAWLARRFLDRTRGLFDPSILPSLRQAGYDRSMDELRLNGPGPVRVTPSWSRPGFGGTRFDHLNRRICLPAGVEIDLGGIAKGWIAGQAAQLLSGYASACAVSAGGDMVMIGVPAGERGWQVALEDPREPTRSLAVLRLGPGAVATSSVVKRSWVQAGKQRHHIIDPRQGAPAETDWLSVTVMAPDPAAAEAFAKALLIAGSARAEWIAASEGNLAYIGVKQDGSLWGSKNSMEVLDGIPETLS